MSLIGLGTELDISNVVLQGILDASREAVLVIDSFMRVIAANSAATEAFCRPVSSLPGRRVSEVIRDAALHDAVRSALFRNQTGDLKIDVTSASETRSYDVHIAPLEFDSAPHAIGFFYDITHLERLEKVRQQFLSNVSHELRTPLTSIIAYVETLEDGALEDAENNRRFLNVIRRNAERMHTLIADIAELSLIETGNVSNDVRSIQLSPVVDELFVNLSSRAEARDIQLINKVESGVVVRADPMRLEQMLTNLIDNAIKFNRDGGSVTVTALSGSASTVISVSDSGEGIVPENLPRIFERFYRIDRGRTREIGGTGLGLAIVKHLARLHGGDVAATSLLGTGTTISIELPTN